MQPQGIVVITKITAGSKGIFSPLLPTQIGFFLLGHYLLFFGGFSAWLKGRTYELNPPYLKIVLETINDANTMETMDISLIRILSEGPDVSLKGSPTVSPTILAL